MYLTPSLSLYTNEAAKTGVTSIISPMFDGFPPLRAKVLAATRPVPQDVLEQTPSGLCRNFGAKQKKEPEFYDFFSFFFAEVRKLSGMLLLVSYCFLLRNMSCDRSTNTFFVNLLGIQELRWLLGGSKYHHLGMSRNSVLPNWKTH